MSAVRDSFAWGKKESPVSLHCQITAIQATRYGDFLPIFTYSFTKKTGNLILPKLFRTSGSQSLFLSLPEKVIISETHEPSSRIWGLYSNLGCDIRAPSQAHPNSGIQVSKSVSDFPERQRWVGLHFQLSLCLLEPTVTILGAPKSCENDLNKHQETTYIYNTVIEQKYIVV